MKLFYLRNENGLPVATVASELDNGIVTFAVAAYNPKDQFSKAKGREIAEGRLKAGKGFARFTQPDTKIVKATILGILSVMHESHTVRKAARELLLSKYKIDIRKQLELVN